MANKRKRLSSAKAIRQAQRKLESDLRWSWIGSEVTHIDNITPELCLKAAGLNLQDDRRPCRNNYARGTTKLSRRADGSHILFIDSDDDDDELNMFSCDKGLCKDNPFCLNFLGQDKWEDEDKAQEAYYKVHFKDDNPTQRTRLDKPVGLRNLGATCYANAFLQVWFRDLAFRAGVYKCRRIAESEDAYRESPIFQLQATFAALQESNQAVFNPKKLVESLQLSTTEQQDAQEFSKLFMSHLDDEFKKQGAEELKSLITDQFEGIMSHTTVCSKCGLRSERKAPFLELEVNLKKGSNLQERIGALLEPEQLRDSNQYFCSSCECLQDATRHTQLCRLPPVLHISVLRFVYDLKTYERKKATLPLKFPAFLDMRPFVSDGSDEVCQYELRGVLLHKGPSAYHGHYEAQVYDETEDRWFQFNDTEVIPLSSFYDLYNGDASKPIIVEDDNGIQPAKRRKKEANRRRVDDSDVEVIMYANKVPFSMANLTSDVILSVEKPHIKSLSSKDVYMLVYGRRYDRGRTATDALIPPEAARSAVAETNSAHDYACQEYRLKESIHKREFTAIRTVMQQFFSSWNVIDSNSCIPDCFVVSKQALQEWVEEPLKMTMAASVSAERPSDGSSASVALEDGLDRKSATTPLGPHVERTRIINNSILLCGHNVKNLDNACVYFDPRSDKELKVISKQTRDKLAACGVSFRPELRATDVCRRCVEDEFVERVYLVEHPKSVADFKAVCEMESDTEGFWISKAWLREWQMKRPGFHSCYHPDPPPDSADYLRHTMCKHETLGLTRSSRRRISEAAAAILLSLFPAWQPLAWNVEECSTCDVEFHVRKEKELAQRKQVEEEQVRLMRFVAEDIGFRQSSCLNERCALVPCEFIQSWKRWSASLEGADRPEHIGTERLICEHGGLLVDVTNLDELQCVACIVTADEWDTLLSLYPICPKIEARCVSKGGRKEAPQHASISTELQICDSCYERNALDFAKTQLSLVVLEAHEAIPSHRRAPASAITEHGEVTFEADFSDQAFPPSPHRRSAKKLIPYNGSSKPLLTLNENGVRQSHRLMNGKRSRPIEFAIDKKTTVGEIRDFAHKRTGIPAYLFRLYYDGIRLDEDERTATDIHIRRCGIVYVQKAVGDTISIDSDSDEEETDVKKEGRKRKSREGNAFKGTLLDGTRYQSPSSQELQSPSNADQKACTSCTLLNDTDSSTCCACGLPL